MGRTDSGESLAPVVLFSFVVTIPLRLEVRRATAQTRKAHPEGDEPFQLAATDERIRPGRLLLTAR